MQVTVICITLWKRRHIKEKKKTNKKAQIREEEQHVKKIIKKF